MDVCVQNGQLTRRQKCSQRGNLDSCQPEMSGNAWYKARYKKAGDRVLQSVVQTPVRMSVNLRLTVAVREVGSGARAAAAGGGAHRHRSEGAAERYRERG